MHEESQEDADSSLHHGALQEMSLDKKKEQEKVTIQDRVIETESALCIIPLSKASEERNAFVLFSQQLPTSPKYNCSLISKALDSESETTTNGFMRTTGGVAGERAKRRGDEGCLLSLYQSLQY